MARANVARRQGDDFQGRLFWLHAAALLDPQGSVTRVAYETGPKAFDDILIEYDLRAAPRDHEGRPICRRHIQCKWHTTAGTFGHADLADPAFVNATRFSILQRAREAQQRHAPDGLGCRFELITNWRIVADDPLIDLIGKSSDAIRLDRLFQGKTAKSRMGKVRKLWRDHLELDDDALRLVARVLAVAETPESLMQLRDRLDDKFAAVGMKRVSPIESAFFYDDLLAKLVAQGRIDFDRDSFREMACSEGILADPAPSDDALVIGIRSFMHPIDNLESRCDRMLNLVPNFDGRYTRDPADWHDQILPGLREFIFDAARTTDRLRVILDAHVSLAFAVGALLNVKSGKRVEIEQRTGGRRFWSMDDAATDPAWPGFVFEHERLREDRDEIAVAVSVTHDVSRDARAFVTRELPGVGQILHCIIEGGPSQQALRCGSHAWQLAEALLRRLSEIRASGKHFSRVHVFIAGPNGFAFVLGQQPAIGPAAVYEWDFEGQRDGSYSLGLRIEP
ncbi:MAG: SAVED domain-containing protein [Dehalococcoidia bacterium]